MIRAVSFWFLITSALLSLNVSAQQTAGIPKGAVMAFNLIECPQGWTDFTAANGRTIVGVGQSAPEADAYTLGATGGEAAHTLTVEEMPQHNHGMVGAGNSLRLPHWNPSQVRYSVPRPNTRDETFRSPQHPEGWSQGAEKPHNNMPPYIVLRYCEKQ